MRNIFGKLLVREIENVLGMYLQWNVFENRGKFF